MSSFDSNASELPEGCHLMHFTKKFEEVTIGSWVETAPPGDHRYNLSVFVQIASLLSIGDHL